MEPLPLQTVQDDAHAVVLRASQLSHGVATVFFGLLAAGLPQLFPELQAAPVLFAGVALWQASKMLHLHEMRLEASPPRLIYRNGRRFAPPLYDGLPDDGRGTPWIRLAIAPHQGDPGIVATRLRSRVLVWHLTLPDHDPVDLRFSFPMGPAAARQKASELTESFRVEVIDRTSEAHSLSPPASDED